MAFDLLSGETTKSDWSRGDFVTDAAVARAKKLPWLKIGAIGLAGIGAFLLFSGDEKKTEPQSRRRRRPTWDEMTQEIPRESMKHILATDPAKVYGRR